MVTCEQKTAGQLGAHTNDEPETNLPGRMGSPSPGHANLRKGGRAKQDLGSVPSSLQRGARRTTVPSLIAHHELALDRAGVHSATVRSASESVWVATRSSKGRSKDEPVDQDHLRQGVEHEGHKRHERNLSDRPEREDSHAMNLERRPAVEKRSKKGGQGGGSRWPFV